MSNDMENTYEPTVKINKELAQKYVDDIRYRIKMIRTSQSVIEQKMLCEELVYFFIPRILSEKEIYLTDKDLEDRWNYLTYEYRWDNVWSKDIRSTLDKINHLNTIKTDFYLFSENHNNSSETRDHIVNLINDMNKTIDPLINKIKESLIGFIDYIANKLETDIKNDES